MNDKIRNTELYKIIKRIIDAEDPENLLSSGRSTEGYDIQCEKIAEQLDPNMTMPEIAETIKNVLNGSFSANYTIGDFIGAASNIYDSFGGLIDLSSGKPRFRDTAISENEVIPEGFVLDTTSFNITIIPDADFSWINKDDFDYE